MESRNYTQEDINRLREICRYENGKLISLMERGVNVKVGQELGGSINKRGYRSFVLDGQRWLLHRAIFAVVHGYLPECVDHIDHNVGNNSVGNLRAATKSQNCANKKVRGVGCRQLKSGKWESYATNTTEGKRAFLYLGRFNTKAEAEAASLTYKKEKYGAFYEDVPI